MANVSWTSVPTPAGGSAVTSYVVVIYKNGSEIARNTVASTQTSLNGVPVTPGDSYVARVYARNSIVEFYDWNSTESGIFVAPGAPTQVSITTISNSSTGATTLTWNPASASGSSGALRYFVTRVSSLSDGCPSDYATHSASGALQATDGDKSPGTYYLAVIAVNDFGCSSTATQVEVLAPPTYSAVSCILGPVSNSQGPCGANLAPSESFVLQFTGLGAISGSLTYQAKIGSSNWLELSAEAGDFVTGQYDATGYASNGITAGTGQTVVVRACLSASNCSPPSAAQTIDIPTPTP